MNPYRSIKLNLYRVDNLVTFGLVIVSGACAVKGFIHLSYGILSCIFIIAFIEMLCEGKKKENREVFCNCGCTCPKPYHTDERLTFWCILCSISVMLAGFLKGESLLLVLLTGLCIISACQPYGISYYTNALQNRFNNVLDKLECSIQEGAPFSMLANTKTLYIEDACILSGEDSIVEQIYTENYSIDITGGTYSVLGEFFQNGRSVRIKNSPTLTLLLDIGILCGNGNLEKGSNPNWMDNKVIPTGTNEEKALLVAAAKAGRFTQNIPYTKLFKTEFINHTTIAYCVVADKSGNQLLFATGDYEDMITKCDFKTTDCGTFPLTPKAKTRIKDTVNNIIVSGGKPIIAACSTLSTTYHPEKCLSGLTYVGIYNLKSPISQSTLGALERLKREDIHPIIYSRSMQCSLDKFSSIPNIKTIEAANMQEDIPTCYYQNQNNKHALKVVSSDACSPNIVMTEKGLTVLPNLIHTIRKLELSIDSVSISLVSGAFILCICSLFCATIRLPVAAFPIYIMNYFLLTSIFMIVLLIFIPYKHSYDKPYIKRRIPLENELIFRNFLRASLCAVLGVEMFNITLSYTQNSTNAVTGLVVTSILIQVMAIVESKLVYSKFVFVLAQKILVSIVCCAVLYAFTSIHLISSLSGLAQLPVECFCMCLGSAVLCDFLTNIFFVKLK